MVEEELGGGRERCNERMMRGNNQVESWEEMKGAR